jgi:heptosyltransferase III
MTTAVDRSSVRKILVIKLRAIGDVILSTVVAKNLRMAFPEAQIDFLTEPPSQDVVRNNPFLSSVIVYDLRSHGALHYLRRIRQANYDLVLDLFGNPRTALLTRFSGARHRVGYDFRGRTYAYTTVVRPRGDRVHNTQFNLDALESIGVPVIDRSLHVPIGEGDRTFVGTFLAPHIAQNGPLVAVNTGGGWYTKRWGLERFASLADLLVDRYGVSILLTWGPGQLEEVQTLRTMMKHSAIVPPSTNLRQLGALLEKCLFMVTNDSGPMHLATAVGTPVLGIYGPTNPVLQGPYGEKHVVVRNEGLDCLGCNLTSCPIGHPCMLELAVDTVAEAVQHLVEKNGFNLTGR